MPPRPWALAHLVKRMSASYLRWKRSKAVLSSLVLSSSSLSLQREPRWAVRKEPVLPPPSPASASASSLQREGSGGERAAWLLQGSQVLEQPVRDPETHPGVGGGPGWQGNWCHQLFLLSF